MFSWSVPTTTTEVLAEIRDLITAHARPDMTTPIDRLMLGMVETDEEHHSLATPLLVVMAQGGKRIMLSDQVFEYRAGDFLLVSADLPITGNFVGASPEVPAMGMSIELRPETIAPLLATAPPPARAPHQYAMATGEAGPELLDAAVRMLRLLDRPDDAPVLAPLIEREILWRLVTGPHGAMVRQIGLSDGALAHVNRAIQWIRENYAEPVRVADLARLAGLSPSAFHRHYRAITGMSPLQYQKRIRLQEARSLLVARAGDVVGVAHLVGYDSPSQFNREYRRLFGAPPGKDAARLRG